MQLTEPIARLSYEPLTAAHAAKLSAALMDPRVYTYITAACPKTLLELEAEFTRVAARPPANHQN